MYQEPTPKVEAPVSPDMKRRSPTNVLSNELIDSINAESEIPVNQAKRTKQDDESLLDTKEQSTPIITTLQEHNIEPKIETNIESQVLTNIGINKNNRTNNIVPEDKNTQVTIKEEHFTATIEGGDSNQKVSEMREKLQIGSENSPPCKQEDQSQEQKSEHQQQTHEISGNNDNSGKKNDTKYEIRLLLATKMAGAVIGRQGSVIKKLRTEYNANISIPDKKMPERVLTISASFDNIMKIFDVVLPRILEEQRNTTDDNEVRMIVHQSQAGAIIGRGGSKVKELREKSHAYLKVYTDFCPRSTDRVIQITGNQEKIRTAVSLIIDYLRTIPIKGNIQNYDASNYNPSHINSYGGYPSPMMGRDILPPYQLPHGRGIQMHSRGPERSYYDPGYSYNGPPMYNCNTKRSGGGGGGYQGPPPQYSRPAPIDYVGINRSGGIPPPPPGGQDYTIQTNQVSIPNNYCGLVIGKEGSKIKQIRQKSGAKIDVEPSNGSLDRIITIQGTYSQIQMAQYLLQSCIKNQESTGAKRTYGGQRYQ
ncbi:Heterogeneous nuclear ribonucleoprotein K [Strongyloides ratti]|uniref:Heterogeneous nuclear ribonucleoprotein K n=1 Tax=Strongyloides ratti TaxID=34506 RepID=A0A090LAD1_STRRB|nr:Heterogeneous nuclear ribonucleoprotein K [Strongyloides ratti]CEF65103.1 Heterogeneous nuclear ribonucleoprotein K [Strongyloides ratti]